MKHLRVTPTPLDTGGLMAAISALFGLTLRQHANGRRLWVIGILFLIPAVLALVLRLRFGADVLPRENLEVGIILALIPQILLPLMALLYAGGMIQDEVDDQTLTYLLIRPVPRWSIYLTKLLTSWLLMSVVAGVFTALTYIVIYAGQDGFWSEIVAGKIPKMIVIFSLGLLAYSTIFGCLGLLTRYTLLIGIGYIILIEGLLANFDFPLRTLAVMYYMRVLALRWLDFEAKEWQIDVEDTVSGGVCVLILSLASIAATALALTLFRKQEFRVKTPGAD